MLMNTRRRALALLVAAGAGLHFLSATRVFAAPEEEGQEPEQGEEQDQEQEEAEDDDCFDQKNFGPWIAQATDSQAGARMNLSLIHI